MKKIYSRILSMIILWSTQLLINGDHNLYAQNEPIIIDAPNGEIGADFSVLQDGDISYVTTQVNYTGSDYPGDDSRVNSYEVTFAESGIYNLFARIRVGAGGADDDSFFYGNDFGRRDTDSGGGWKLVNGLFSAGFIHSTEYVDGPGNVGSSQWKWVNLTKNGYHTNAGLPFEVTSDQLTVTFQIGSREDGLDIDKLAFGNASLFYTVEALENGLPGSTSMENNNYVYEGPQIGQGHDKFLGCAHGSETDFEFATYWNQITPGNAGKWGSVGRTPDTLDWDWSQLDYIYNYAKDNEMLFKNHVLVWGQQQPYWISNLPSDQQLKYIETWIRMVGERYPDINMIDVVNEPLYNHNPPDGISGRANYKEALGGSGETGWDWVIKSFELARKYMPNAELHLNDYGIINSNSATSTYLQIITLLQDRGLIDGIGVQGHRFALENTSVATLKYNLDRLGETGLPVYISEMDLGNYGNTGIPDDEVQLELYQRIFPVLWEHPAVHGITLWGYREGLIWQETAFLVNHDGTWRPAMEWLAEYLGNATSTTGDYISSDTKINYLKQNFPNPVTTGTQITYMITQHTNVTLEFYDTNGKLQEVILNEKKSPGEHSVYFEPNQYPDGIYYYLLRTGYDLQTRKLIIARQR